jgi:glyceraldehyde 3-phosphate dehydrogenase
MAKIAINGLGRIGRATLKILMDTPELELVGINDIVPTDNLAYLLKYDTVYGVYEKTVENDEDHLIIGGVKIPVFKEKDPSNLPWKDLGVDIVFESTGVFSKTRRVEKTSRGGCKVCHPIPAGQGRRYQHGCIWSKPSW